MPCYSPLQAWRSRYVNANGKRPLVFNRSDGFLDFSVLVPCGVCIGCRIERSRIWALRCVHESKLHFRNCFVTLTYSDDKLPVNGSLDKKHLQGFLKRLRHRFNYKIRYFGCGEYGEKYDRPHYHLILFGCDFSEDRKFWKNNKQGDPIYVSDCLSSSWNSGHCTVQSFSYSTAAYTARYVLKKYRGRDSQTFYQRVCVETGETYQLMPEFACMSLKPGIGAGWYDLYKKDAFPSDFVVVDGKKHSVPRFYYEKLRLENPDMHRKISLKRRKALIHNVHNSPDRLAVREIVKISQVKNLTRGLHV